MSILKKIFITLFLIFIIYLILSFTLIPYLIKNKLITSFPKTNIKEVQFNPFKLDLKIFELNIKDENNYNIVSLKDFRIKLNFAQSILNRCLCINKITIDNLELNITQDKDNNLNIFKILPNEDYKENNEINEEKTQFKFLISLINIKNSKINFTSHTNNEIFKISFSDINYKVSNLGNINDLQSLNSLEFNINQHTKIHANSSLNINNSLAFGDIKIDNLFVKDFIDFNKRFFNFQTNEKAKINVNFEYEINFKEYLSLKIKTNLFNLNELVLTQDKSFLGSLNRLDIEKFEFDLYNKNIKFKKVLIDDLKANMIIDKNGFNYSSLINVSKEKYQNEENMNDEFYENFEDFYENIYYDEYYNDIYDEEYENFYTYQEENNVVNDEIQKYWFIQFSDIIANLHCNLNDKINNQDFKVDYFDLNLKNLKINNSFFTLDSAKILNKNIEYNSNKLKAKSNNNEIFIDNLIYKDDKLEFSQIDLNNIDLFINLKQQNNTNKKYNKNEIPINDDEANFVFELGNINLNKLNLNLVNENFNTPFNLSIENINGQILKKYNDLDDNNFDVKVSSVINKYSPSIIHGQFDSKNFRNLTNLDIKFKNLALNDFSSYSAKYIGKKIDSGKLDLNLKYNIKNSNLNSKNNIIINNIKLGKDTKDAYTILPIKAAVGLLEDKNKIININLPVSGNIDSPKFNLLDILWQSFTAFITKAVTAPLSILAYAFNFNEKEINLIKFENNMSDIEPIQQETLDKIALILQIKNNVSIKLIPSYDEKNESRKIGIQRIQNIKEYLVDAKEINKNQIILDDNNENKKSTSIALNIEYSLE